MKFLGQRLDISPRWLGVLAFFLILLQPLRASAVDTTRLLTHKDWIVRHEFYPDTDGQACAARTTSRNGDVLDITLWEDADHTVYLFMKRPPWSGSFQDDLKLDVDYTSWTLGDAYFYEDGTVDFEFRSADKLFDFLGDLMESRALALKTPDERSNIAVWSLSGSYASILKLFECFERIDVSNSGSTYGPSSQYGR